MVKELEVKILNVNLDEMEIKLKSLGAILISKEEQINTLIDSEDNYIQKKLDSYMRIRETKSLLTEDIKITLTMKRNILREGIRENIEINTDIMDKDTMLETLGYLGYNIIQEGYKKRTSYILGSVRFDLDIWDKATYPYPYMEIEVNDEDELKDMIKLLDIPEENISTKSIVELKMEAKLL